MKFRGGEFPTGTKGNFQPELTTPSSYPKQLPQAATPSSYPKMLA